MIDLLSSLRRAIRRGCVVLIFPFLFLSIELDRFYWIQPRLAMPLIGSALLEADANGFRGAVVLTGNQQRLQEAIGLLRTGELDLLFISGVYPSVKLPYLLQVLQQSNAIQDVCVGEQEGCIELGHAATNTRGNACETLHWLERHNVGRFYLMTSDYHWLRSYLEFATILGRYGYGDVEILPYLVFSDGFAGRRWLGEYGKWLVARGRILLEDILLGRNVGGCPRV